MQQISSGQTVVVKRLFPAFWVGLLLVFALGALAGRARIELTLFLLLLASAAVIGLLVFRRLVWDLADDVLDGGDHLLVRRGGVAERVSLANVLDVSVKPIANPLRVSLRLYRPGRLGDKVVFIPRSKFRFNPLARKPVAESLVARVEQLRHAPRDYQ